MLGFTGALAVRRASPPLSLAIAWIAAVLQMLWAVPPRFADVAVFAVLYATAAYGTRLVFWLGLASAVVGAGVITLYVLLGPLAVGGAQPSVREFGLVLGAALFSLLLSWTAGALARTVLARANRLAQVRAQAAAVAEAERVRIARDMHDVVAHSLAVVIAQADRGQVRRRHRSGRGHRRAADHHRLHRPIRAGRCAAAADPAAAQPATGRGGARPWPTPRSSTSRSGRPGWTCGSTSRRRRRPNRRPGCSWRCTGSCRRR